jgi:uncharacterized protein with FMN-binding domain
MKNLLTLATVLILSFTTVGCVDDSGTQLEGIDLANVNDGTYIGECITGPVLARVQVTVRDHRITNLNILKHRTGWGSEAEKITSKVLAQQSLDVDAITGATLSSKTILKAIENALKQGL